MKSLSIWREYVQCVTNICEVLIHLLQTKLVSRQNHTVVEKILVTVVLATKMLQSSKL